MNAKDLKEFAQLAQAAYGDFSSSAIRNGQQLKLELPHKDFGKFAPAEAALFTERYELVHQFTEGFLGAGFSASLFRDLDSSHGGQLIFAVRGTEPTFLLGAGVELIRDLLYTDSRIGLDGYASPQVIPMYRYFKQLLTPAGAAVAYSPGELAALRTVYLDMTLSPQTTPGSLAYEFALGAWSVLQSNPLEARVRSSISLPRDVS